MVNDINYNFACVCYGDKYAVEYVQKLYNMVKRNTTLPINFVVFTDHVKMHKMVERDIDIRQFPEKFDDNDQQEIDISEDSDLRSDGNRQRPSTVVAPAKRTSGARPRKVHLTKTQVALASRLGITPEGYAKQLLKLENQNG